jgi:hypothetical protein
MRKSLDGDVQLTKRGIALALRRFVQARAASLLEDAVV